MQIYINKNNQQLGPFTEEQVKEMLASGQLSPKDLGVRYGEAKWSALFTMFPQATEVSGNSVVLPVTKKVLYRNNKFHILISACFLLFSIAAIFVLFYFYWFASLSGDVEKDIASLSLHRAMKASFPYLFLMLILSILAFLFSLKKKVINSIGAKTFLVGIFMLTMFFGIGCLGFGVYSFVVIKQSVDERIKKDLIYSNAKNLKIIDTSAQDLVKLKSTPYWYLATFIPAGLGMTMFSLSVLLMLSGKGKPKDE